MGLRDRLLRYAAARPRPIVVTAPHGTRVRLLAESELKRRRWRPAETPVSASVLIVCGTPGHALSQAVDVIWSDMPSPRALVTLPRDRTAEQVNEALNSAMDRLADGQTQRLEAAARITTDRWPPAELKAHDGHEHGGHEHGGHEHGGHEHGEHEHGGQGGGGHDHDHMGMPGGVRLAERGPDRDGLMLDRLHVPLGPVLPYWPSGLVVEVALQGDVIQEAEVWVAGGMGAERFWDEPWLAARAGREVTRGEAARRKGAAHLDSLGRLLAVAGWREAGAQAVRLRDRVLAGLPAVELGPAFDRFAHQVGRSRILRWMLRDLGVIDGSDAWVRLKWRLAAAKAALKAVDDGGLLVDESGRLASDGGRSVGGGGGLGHEDGGLFEGGEPFVDERGRLSGGGRFAARGEGGGGEFGRGEEVWGVVGGGSSEAVLAVLPRLLPGVELAGARLIVASLDPDLDQLESAYEAVRG